MLNSANASTGVILTQIELAYTQFSPQYQGRADMQAEAKTRYVNQTNHITPEDNWMSVMQRLGNSD